MDTGMRLDKLVASAAGIGRAAARRHVTRGQVTVNGARVRDPASCRSILGRPPLPSSRGVAVRVAVSTDEISRQDPQELACEWGVEAMEFRGMPGGLFARHNPMHRRQSSPRLFPPYKGDRRSW